MNAYPLFRLLSSTGMCTEDTSPNCVNSSKRSSSVVVNGRFRTNNRSPSVLLDGAFVDCLSFSAVEESCPSGALDAFVCNPLALSASPSSLSLLLSLSLDELSESLLEELPSSSFSSSSLSLSSDKISALTCFDFKKSKSDATFLLFP